MLRGVDVARIKGGSEGTVKDGKREAWLRDLNSKGDVAPARQRRRHHAPRKTSNSSAIAVLAVMVAVLAAVGAWALLSRQQPTEASAPPAAPAPPVVPVPPVASEPTQSARPETRAPHPEPPIARPEPQDDGIAGTWETEDQRYSVKIQRDGKFAVAGVVAGVEIGFASGKCNAVPATEDLWRCESLALDEDANLRLFRRIIVEDTSRAAAEFMVGFGESGLFRKHGVLFQRVGRFKVMMLGPSEDKGTVGIGWTLRRVD